MERESSTNQPRAAAPRRPDTATPAARSDAPAWQRSIAPREIFEELLVDELRRGRLSRGGRRRVVAYGAQLGLTSTQVARMIERLRDAALADDAPAIRHHALRLVDPPPQRVPFAGKIALVVALAIAVDVLVLWLWCA